MSSRKDIAAKCDEMQAAVEALKRGDKVECRPRGGGRWSETTTPDPTDWNWTHWEFRPKPKPREFWANIYREGASVLHHTREEAEKAVDKYEPGTEIIHLREVIE